MTHSPVVFAALGSDRIPEAEFWASEFTPGLTVSSRVEDLIIYELHVNALGTGKAPPATCRMP